MIDLQIFKATIDVVGSKCGKTLFGTIILVATCNLEAPRVMFSTNHNLLSAECEPPHKYEVP